MGRAASWRAGPAAVRWAPGAFAAFVIQGPVLLAVATAARAVPAPAELTAPVVAVASVALSFWLGRRLHLPARRRAAGRAQRRPPAPAAGGTLS